MRALIAVRTRAQLVNAVPVGWAMRTSGHEVCVATSPDLAPVTRSCGLPGTVDDVAGFARRWRPDLLLADGVAVDLGVPRVRLRSTPSTVDGLVVDPLPACFPAPVERIAVRHVPYEELTVVPDWLWKPPRRPRICVTVPDGLAAVAGLDVEVVAVLDTTAIPAGTRITPATRVVDRVSLDALLPTCAAVLHAGDLGTVCAAVRHGVPQLVFGDLDIGAAGLPAGPGAVERLLGDESVRDGVARLSAELAGRPSPADIVPDLEKLAL